jgi:hypothetical protein
VEFFSNFAESGPAATIRDNLIVITMHHQHRDVHLLEVFRVIGFRKHLYAVDKNDHKLLSGESQPALPGPKNKSANRLRRIILAQTAPYARLTR